LSRFLPSSTPELDWTVVLPTHRFPVPLSILSFPSIRALPLSLHSLLSPWQQLEHQERLSRTGVLTIRRDKTRQSRLAKLSEDDTGGRMTTAFEMSI